MDGLDDLEAEVQSKRRPRKPNRRSEITPPPRRPRTGEDAGESPPVRGHTGVPVHPHTGTAALPYPDIPEPEADTAPPVRAEPPKEKRPAAPAPAPEKRTRPPSVEAYLTEDLMNWLWQVRGAGVARRKDNVTSAVVRLALEELRTRMNPEQVIAALDQVPPPAKGTARGRRR